MSSITAGTRIIRTIVESMSTATAMPKPMSFTVGFWLVTNEANTAIMISAAVVITRAVLATPSTTALRGSPVRSHSSRMRDMRKTS